MGKIIRIATSAALLAVLAWKIDWKQVGHSFAHLRAEWWRAAVALYVTCQVVSGLRWQLLAEPLGFGRPLRQYIGFYFIGMYFSLVLPTSVGGDVIRAWYLDSRSGKRLAAFLSVFVDRLSGFLVLLTLACIAIAVSPIAVPPEIKVTIWGAAGCALLALAALPVMLRFSVFDWRLPVLGKRDAASASEAHEGCVKLQPRTTRIANAFRLYLRRPRLVLGTTALSAFVQVANVALVWLVGRSIAAPVPGAFYWILVPMVTLLTMLPVSLNGVGLREWGMVWFLHFLGVPAGTALSLSFLWFAVSTAAALAGGAVYLFGSFPRPEVPTEHDAFGDHSHQGRAGQPQAAA